MTGLPSLSSLVALASKPPNSPTVFNDGNKLAQAALGSPSQLPTSTQTVRQTNPLTPQTANPTSVTNAPNTTKNLSEADRKAVDSFVALYNAETTAEGRQAKYNAALQTLKSPEAVEYLNQQITEQSKALSGQSKTDFMEKWGKLLAMLIPVLINNGRVDANQVAWWKEAFPLMYGAVKPS